MKLLIDGAKAHERVEDPGKNQEAFSEIIGIQIT